MLLKSSISLKLWAHSRCVFNGSNHRGLTPIKANFTKLSLQSIKRHNSVRDLRELKITYLELPGFTYNYWIVPQYLVPVEG